jgi:hypothetical protein
MVNVCVRICECVCIYILILEHPGKGDALLDDAYVRKMVG